MKYEYLKGSEKDFEGAPESATVRIVENGFQYDIPIFADKFENCSTRTHCATGVYDSYIADVSNWSIIAERRPITEPVVNQQLTTEWDGEGLPPVGALCRYRAFSGMPWVECEVLGWHGDDAWLKRTVDGITFVMGDQELFPIRSPEDVARDEAKVVIAELCRSSASNGHSADLIYDAIAAGKIKGVVLESKVADLKINITTDEMWREFEKKSDMDDVRRLMMDSLAEQRSAFNKSRRGSF